MASSECDCMCVFERDMRAEMKSQLGMVKFQQLERYMVKNERNKEMCGQLHKLHHHEENKHTSTFVVTWTRCLFELYRDHTVVMAADELSFDARSCDTGVDHCWIA